MDARDFYRKCLEQATAVVKQVQAGQLANETPDDEWTARDLANHMLYEVSWVPDMLEGRTIAEVGGKYDGDLFDADVANAQTNLIARWDEAAQKADQAIDAVDSEETVHLSYGDTTASDYLFQTGGDILVHAWDLAKAIGVPYSFDREVADTMWEKVKDYNMSDTGLFKPALHYEETDSAEDKILAHFGRDRNWQPTA